MTSQKCDVVVVGAGIAGLSAGIEAHDRGLRVVVLEKLARAHGNTFYAGGGTMQKVSFPGKILEIARETGHGKIDLTLVETFADHLNDAIDWIARLGIEWTVSSTPVSGRPEEIRKDPISTHRVTGGGRAICRTLVSAAQQRGVKIYFRTRAERILTDSQGKVTGLRAVHEGEPLTFETDNVILATGGFQGDKEMVGTHIGSWLANAKLSGTPHNTGDGHRMALALGACLVSGDQYHASIRNRHRINPFPRLQYGSILVNARGERFINEVEVTKDEVAKATLQQPGSRGTVIFDQGIREIFSKGFEEHLVEFTTKGIPVVREKDFEAIEAALKKDGTLICSPSLEDLGEKLKIPPQNLVSTLSEYRYAIEAGRAAELRVPRTAFAYALLTPPYYAEPVEARLNCTLGGLKINPKAQVINQQGHPIPGLYAAGEIMGGFYYENYQVATGYLPVCLVFGLIAARNVFLPPDGSIPQ